MNSKPTTPNPAAPTTIAMQSVQRIASCHPQILQQPGDGCTTEESTLTKFTIFAIPKPFVGDAERIQLNAIRSWRILAPHCQVLLLGDEPGIAEAACAWDDGSVKHIRGLGRNSSGTPLLDSAFEIAAQVARTPILMYSNCDVIFSKDLVLAVDRLNTLAAGDFVAFGRRTELEIDRLINFEDPDEIFQLQSWIEQRGRWESIVCKEYFIFRRGTFATIPAFAVGRGNWDNWMIGNAKDRSLPVIDVSALVTAVHQSHDYSHVGRNRWKCYVSGAEAKDNQRLAGGRGLIRGSTPTWKLDQKGLHRVPLSGLNLPFWRDLPRFLRFMKKLVVN